jgi:hypothetical protein
MYKVVCIKENIVSIVGITHVVIKVGQIVDAEDHHSGRNLSALGEDIPARIWVYHLSSKISLRKDEFMKLDEWREKQIEKLI